MSSKHTLCVLPWLKLKRDLQLGDFRFLRWPRADQAIGTGLRPSVDAICGTYKKISGHPRESMTLLVEQVPSQLPTLVEADTLRYSKAVDLLGIALFAENAYFAQLGTVCNSTALALYFQNFVPGRQYIAIVRRRRDGQSLVSGLTYDQVSITEPQQCCANDDVDADDTFLAVLANSIGSDDPLDLRILQSSVLYLQANTDGGQMLCETEIVLMTTAIETLFDTLAKAKDFGAAIGQAMQRFESIALKDSSRAPYRKYRADDADLSPSN